MERGDDIDFVEQHIQFSHRQCYNGLSWHDILLVEPSVQNINPALENISITIYHKIYHKESENICFKYIKTEAEINYNSQGAFQQEISNPIQRLKFCGMLC